MNISQIETEYDELYAPEQGFPSYEHSRHIQRKEFWLSKITELLESTKLQPADLDKYGWDELNVKTGYNKAVSDQDKKIDEALN